MNPDVVGWVSTAILILTVGRQAYTQWREKSTKGVSHWLFIGQFAASVGFTIYSILTGNAVFIVSNLFLLVIAAIGQYLLIHNRRAETSAQQKTGSGDGRPPTRGELSSTHFVKHDHQES